MKTILFFVFLFPVVSMANKSFVCPEHNTVYKGVTCCLDAISKQDCQALVDQQLPQKVIDAVSNVQENYKAQAYDYGRVPNCFWQVGVFANLVEFDTHDQPLESYDILDLLQTQQGFHIQEDSAFHFGDILMFYAVGEIREEIIENHIPKRKWYPLTSTEHGAISLGGGLLFQKENIGSSVFSIDSIEHTQKVYESAWNKNPQLRGSFHVEVWRKR